MWLSCILAGTCLLAAARKITSRWFEASVIGEACSHAQEMADASMMFKNLVLYVDHVNLLKTQEIVDDVVLQGTPLSDV